MLTANDFDCPYFHDCKSALFKPSSFRFWKLFLLQLLVCWSSSFLPSSFLPSSSLPSSFLPSSFLPSSFSVFYPSSDIRRRPSVEIKRSCFLYFFKMFRRIGEYISLELICRGTWSLQLWTRVQFVLHIYRLYSASLSSDIIICPW